MPFYSGRIILDHPPASFGFDLSAQHGVYHRDLKPENVLLDSTGRVTSSILASHCWRERGGLPGETCLMCWYPDYISPEQIQETGDAAPTYIRLVLCFTRC